MNSVPSEKSSMITLRYHLLEYRWGSPPVSMSYELYVIQVDHHNIIISFLLLVEICILCNSSRLKYCINQQADIIHLWYYDIVRRFNTFFLQNFIKKAHSCYTDKNMAEKQLRRKVCRIELIFITITTSFFLGSRSWSSAAL